MKTVVALIWMSLLAFSAAADPIDPDPDGIGIYFDEGAEFSDSWCATADVGTQVSAYLCLTRAQDQSGFVAWEGRIECSVPGALVDMSLRGDATNNAAEPEYVVSFGTPLPYQISTVLMELTIDVVWEWPIGLRVWPADSPSGGELLPAYATFAAPATYRTLGYSLGWDPGTKDPNWCAAINDDTCLTGPTLPVEDSSWGGIKALYR